MSASAYNVAAVVLNWNSYHDTVECLNDLLNQSCPGLKILIVDNGSSDGSCKRLQQEFNDIRLLRNDKNRGFTGGMNRGIDYALSDGFEFVLLVNNDVRFPNPNTVAELVKRYKSEPSLGALSPMTVSETNSVDTDDINFYTPRNGRTGYFRFSSEVSNPDLSYGSDYSCILFSRKVLASVGSFDEQYFLYFEDIEHGARIENEGYHLATDETIVVEHKSHASSSSPIGPLPSYYDTRNRLLFIYEYNSLWEYLYLIPLYLWWFCTRFLYRLYRKNIAGALGMVEGVADAIRGNTGKGPYP
jgi:GT2 family glycosyltransferase